MTESKRCNDKVTRSLLPPPAEAHLTRSALGLKYAVQKTPKVLYLDADFGAHSHLAIGGCIRTGLPQ